MFALETAIKNPKAHIHYAAPTKEDLREFILPIFNQLLLDCPEDLRPEWKHFQGKWVFPNGSFIRLCGCNNKQFNNLRGNKSDLFIIDEAAQVDDLEEVINSVALPQLLSSTFKHKRIILPSTPPTTPDHPYKKYAEDCKAVGAYSTFTIHDSWYPKDEIERMVTKMGGWDSTNVRRELLCQFVTDEALQIVPEWSRHPEYICEVPKNDLFQFYHILEGLDVGYRDFTAWLMGYWDFSNACLIIEYELAMRENEFTTENLATGIKRLEGEYRNLNNTKRIRRIADNANLNILADLGRMYQLPFGPVSKKQGKEWMVNQLRQLIKAGKLKVHPRCKMLIASLEFGIWKKGRDEFGSSEKLGHYDFIDALVYMVSNLVPAVQAINPIPPLYQLPVSTMMFPNGMPKNGPVEAQDSEIRKMFPNIFKERN